LILLTNNILVKEKYGKEIEVKFYEESLCELLFRVRDFVHIGHKLLTHPLSGSIKPNETKFKSVLISKEKSSEKTDLESIQIIENSIGLVKNFPAYEIPNEHFDHLRQIDLILISGAIR